jgi:hypothetical protein
LLFITQQYINSEDSRSGIVRLLKGEGMSRQADVIPKAEAFNCAGSVTSQRTLISAKGNALIVANDSIKFDVAQTRN